MLKLLLKACGPSERFLIVQLGFSTENILYWFFHLSVITTGGTESSHSGDVYTEMFTEGTFTDVSYFKGPVQPNHCSHFSHSALVVTSRAVWRAKVWDLRLSGILFLVMFITFFFFLLWIISRPCWKNTTLLSILKMIFFFNSWIINN